MVPPPSAAAILSVSGVATASTSSLSSGNHIITPVYSGDSNYNPHTGASITQIVTGGAPAVTLSPTSLAFPVTLLNVASKAAATLS